MEERLVVGEWHVDPFSNRLQRGGPEPTERAVEPKVMQVLQALARAPGEVVTKEQLFERVWGGPRLTDDVLVVTVSALRRALGDSARRPHYVQTVPGQGYRLVASVTRVGLHEGRRRRLLLLAAAAAGLAALLLPLGLGRGTSTTVELVDGALQDRLVEARYLLRRREPAALSQARVEALDLLRSHPDLASVHLLVAEVAVLEAEFGDDRGRALDEARDHAETSLALHETAAARAVLGQVRLWADWDPSAAEAELRRALDLDPDEPRALLLYGSVLLATGRPGPALELVRAYERSDPHAFPSPFRAFALTAAGRLDEAQAHLERAISHAPEDADLRLFLARLLDARGDAEGCYRAYDAFLARRPAEGETREILRARYEDEGLVGIRTFVHERLESRLRSGARVSPVDLAAACVALGRVDDAFSWLEEAWQRRDLRLPFVAGHPAFRSVAGDARYRELMDRI